MDRLKRIGYVLLAVATIAGAPGCEEDTSRPEPPPPPPPLNLEVFSLQSAPTHRLPDNDVYDIIVDSSGRPWIATDTGLAMIDPNRTNPAVKFDDFDGIPNRKMRALLEFKGKIFVGTWGGGVAIYDGATWEALPLLGFPANGVVTGRITDLAPDPVSNNHVWIGTVAGMTRYWDSTAPMPQRFTDYSDRLDDPNVTPLLPTWRDVTSLLVRNDPTRGKEVWVTRREEGIVVVRFPTGQSIYRPDNTGIPSELCNEVIFDNVSNEFWAAFYDVGLASVDVPNSLWTNYSRTDGHVSDQTWSLAVRSNGDIWFGSQKGVTRRKADGTVTNFVKGSGLPDERVRKVYVDPATDDVWLGFVNGGAARVLNPD